MKLDEPIGSPLYAPFFIRLGLGSYFILAGLMKLDRLPNFVQQVKSFQILPDKGALLYGLLIPYFEVAFGTLLVVGFWTTLAGTVVSLMLVSYIVALGTFPNTPKLFNKDIILLGGALSLLFSGPGAFSFDRFRKGS